VLSCGSIKVVCKGPDGGSGGFFRLIVLRLFEGKNVKALTVAVVAAVVLVV
jgi:hypothetical protein